MKKRYWILTIVLALLVGATFYPFFPDPYHEKGSVCLWEWIYRELDELLHGEKG